MNCSPAAICRDSRSSCNVTSPIQCRRMYCCCQIFSLTPNTEDSYPKLGKVLTIITSGEKTLHMIRKTINVTVRNLATGQCCFEKTEPSTDGRDHGLAVTVTVVVNRPVVRLTTFIKTSWKKAK